MVERLRSTIPPYRSGMSIWCRVLNSVVKEPEASSDPHPSQPERGLLAQVQDLRGAEQRPEGGEVAFDLQRSDEAVETDRPLLPLL